MRVAVVGAGIVGAATARALARRGIEVELIDAGEVSGGTTGLGEGNVLCSDKDAGPELELAVLGRAAYDEIEASLRRARADPPQGRAGRAPQRGRGSRPSARGSSGCARRASSASCSEPAQARALEPGLGELLGATWVPGDLQCDPRAIAQGDGGGARASRVRTHTRVDDLGALRADQVVLAAGPWSAALARTAGLHLPLEPRKGQLVRLAGRMEIRHKVVDGSYLAAVAAADAALQISTVIETTFDGHVLVGSSRERKGFDTSVDPAVTERLLQSAAARWCPAVAALRAEAAWAGLRPWLPDGLPALGRSATGVWVATGHEGAGDRAGADQRRAARRRDQRRDAALLTLRRLLLIASVTPARYGPTRHSAPSPSGSRMTWPSATWSISALLGRDRVGRAVVRRHHRRDLVSRQAVGERRRARRAGPRAAACDRASGRGWRAGRRRPRRAGSRRPRAAARRARRSATARCSAPARRSGRPCPAPRSASPRRCAPRRGRPGRRPRPRGCRARRATAVLVEPVDAPQCDREVVGVVEHQRRREPRELERPERGVLAAPAPAAAPRRSRGRRARWR